MAKTRKPARKPSAAQIEARKAEVAAFKTRLDEFETATDADTVDDITARFPQYTARNNIMIYLQAPAAVEVFAYRAWQEKGRQVKRGEAGIRIWAPAGKADDQTATDGTVLKEGRQFFRLVSVFDVSQTEDAAVLARQKAEAEAAAATLTTAAAFGDLVSA